METDISFYFQLLLLAGGITCLVWGADQFVIGAAGIAKNLGISPLVIGLTIVSIGTSAPEILVSATAALKGSTAMAVGNALGSNLANLGLVLGITAIIAPLKFSRRIAASDTPIMMIVTVVAGIFLFDNILTRWESIALVIGLVVFLLYTAKTESGESGLEIIKQEPSSKMGSILRAIGGLLLLLLSSNVLVSSASAIASTLGVSDLVIGVTVLAVGTSLPELAASVASALKGHIEMAIGNVLGSNIFNLLAVLSVAGILSPGPIEGANFIRDYGSVFILSIYLVIVCGIKYHSLDNNDNENPCAQNKCFLGRGVGVPLLAAYIGYYVLLFA